MDVADGYGLFAESLSLERRRSAQIDGPWASLRNESLRKTRAGKTALQDGHDAHLPLGRDIRRQINDTEIRVQVVNANNVEVSDPFFYENEVLVCQRNKLFPICP